MITQVLLEICSFSLAILSWQQGSLFLIYLSLFGIGVARAFYQPAASTLMPTTVPPENFTSAATWGSTAWQTASIIGPAIAGVLVATLPWSGTAGPVTTTQILSFGHYPGDSLAVGQIDEVSIWNAVLPADKIRLYAGQGLNGTETNLVAYYRLDEGAGTVTLDGSGKGNNGTLQGGAAWVTGPAQASRGRTSRYSSQERGVWWSSTTAGPSPVRATLIWPWATFTR